MIKKAINFANIAHFDQFRKGTDIPYIFHPINVGKILIENFRCGEDVVVAGILHDTLEDTPVKEKDISDIFGENVLQLVKSVSERDKSDTWENRKKEVIEHLREAEENTILIKLADVYDNITAMQRDYHFIGDELWKRFNAPKERLAWYYWSLGEIFDERLKQINAKILIRRYKITYSEFLDFL